MASLEILEPEPLRSIYPLNKPSTLIGRYPFCDILLESPTISRCHARLTRTELGYLLEDLNSINGTFLNDRPLMGQMLLKEGDQLRFYEVHAVFRSVDSSSLPDQHPQAEQDGTPESLEENSSLETVTDHFPGTPAVQLRTHYLDHPGEPLPHLFSQGKFQSLLRVIQQLGGSLKLDEILIRILDGLFQVYPQSRRGLIWLREADGQLTLRAAKQGGSETVCSDTLGPISLQIAQQVMTRREAVLTVEEASQDWAESIFELPLRSSICLPLMTHQGDAMGVLYLDTLDSEERFEALDLEVVGSVLSVAVQAVEFAQQHEVLLKQHEILKIEQARRQHIEKELQSARIVQDQLYPSNWPKWEQFDLAGATFPAESACGDYYDWFPLNNEEVVIAVGDVSGHGLRAALRMIEARACLRVLLEHITDLEEVVARLHRYLCRSFSPGQFLTLFLAKIHLPTRTLVYCGAGQEAYLISAKKTVFRLESTGGPLGLLAENKIELSSPYTLQPGQLLVLPTDGILETADARKAFFGKQRLWNLIYKNRNKTASEIVEIVYHSVRNFAGDAPQLDDLTLMILRTL